MEKWEQEFQDLIFLNDNDVQTRHVLYEKIKHQTICKTIKIATQPTFLHFYMVETNGTLQLMQKACSVRSYKVNDNYNMYWLEKVKNRNVYIYLNETDGIFHSINSVYQDSVSPIQQIVRICVVE
jgi:hypothetical protein